MKNYLISISSEYLIQEELNKIIDPNSVIINLNYNDIEIDDVILECSYTMLTESSKTVIVKNFKLNESSNKIINYLNEPIKNTMLILITPTIDKRTNLYKSIKDKVNIIEIKDLKREDINNKINMYCKKNNIKIDYQSLNKIIDNNNQNIDLIISEINKFKIITNNINNEIIDKYSSILLSDDSFELCDAIVEKKIKIIPNLLDEFIQAKKEVIPFISLLALQYRYIYACKVINKSPDYLMKLFNVKSNYPFKKASTRTTKYTQKELEEILIKLSDIDFELKSTDKDKYTLLKQIIAYIL